MSSLSIISSRLLLSLLFLQDGGGVLQRIWYYISYPLPFFNERISVGRVVIGIAVVFLTLSLAGRFSSLLDRRLAKRRHIDPGLRYTIARVVRYLFILVGILIALKQFSIDLTSIAVLFTALSVGIDSALVLALAAEALGANNVLAVMMPSPYSSRSSIDDSVELCRRLGVNVIERPITDAFNVLLNELHLPAPTTGGHSTATENLQSRLRGNILMTISNAEGRLLLSTGNKSELALGYCTLYGDTNGGLAVIGDVLKTEVYALARYLNREQEIIPAAIIEKRPSAELAPGQFDDQSLPPYDKLDPILQMYFEQKATPEEIIAAGHAANMIYDILNRVEAPANEFKRRQLPPTLIISRNAIGIGRRRPVTHHYRREPGRC